MRKIFIVHGPRGCGKTRFASQIAKSLTGSADAYVDEWDETQPLQHGKVHLTVQRPGRIVPGVTIIAFDSLNFRSMTQR
ncbi:hypothetical protein [Novosphingobium sp. ST904]|uniref:hypothetical protein n=1 Tax=Novosphingobium sp. ST904 TaxID=1684385 RepID=UPI0006C8C879|nr:hypothetical protein [Novosphingobium sp. ST904]KPH59164.1 hypothetical protein ADT71_23760 [Novosphingobium sp. ST904]TCM37753.1 hypothetical protein EDF59_110149 [Novosphingobium sp. ST904]